MADMSTDAEVGPTPEQQEPKYFFDGGRVVNRASGDAIPLDEPVMVFRARDRHAVALIHYYRALVPCGPAEHSRAVENRLADFSRFAREHPERMKEPDTDPAIAKALGQAGAGR